MHSCTISDYKYEKEKVQPPRRIFFAPPPFRPDHISVSYRKNTDRIKNGRQKGEGRTCINVRSPKRSEDEIPFLFIILGCFFTPQSHATCFQGDCLNGQGAYRSANGVIFIGQWQDGKYHGQGDILYPDGSRYEGSWQAGKYHGHGTVTMPDGRKRTGLFANQISRQPWYTPKHRVDWSMLPEIEKANIKFISKFQTQPD